MEDGGVDRTVIDYRQNQLSQMADFPPFLTYVKFLLMHDVPQTKNVHENSPKVSTKIHPQKMSTRILHPITLSRSMQ